MAGGLVVNFIHSNELHLGEQIPAERELAKSTIPLCGASGRSKWLPALASSGREGKTREMGRWHQ